MYRDALWGARSIVLFPEVKQLQSEANQSLHPSSRFMNELSYPSAPFICSQCV